MDSTRARPFHEKSRGKSSQTTNGHCAARIDRTGTLDLRELQERLQARALENAAREEQPPTCREYQVRSVVISSYKKNTDGAYHRHNREDWTAAQRVRRRLGKVLRAAENSRRHSALDYRGQSRPGLDEDPGPLASGGLQFLGRSNAPGVGVPRDD